LFKRMDGDSSGALNQAELSESFENFKSSNIAYDNPDKVYNTLNVLKNFPHMSQLSMSVK